ncbi:hypothetical protein BpHYR1_028856 [Brachionus plicatilis]|uniref:Uncharacterized protein n=1 Tax=Brachionus plicatilis TaxID=10195 RepID=A0A3M7R1C0_BRAPC|nr:hypothetical protein BpHYR1_028856 [Brachionus plicatilis]
MNTVRIKEALNICHSKLDLDSKLRKLFWHIDLLVKCLKRPKDFIIENHLNFEVNFKNKKNTLNSRYFTIFTSAKNKHREDGQIEVHDQIHSFVKRKQLVMMSLKRFELPF